MVFVRTVSAFAIQITMGTHAIHIAHPHVLGMGIAYMVPAFAWQVGKGRAVARRSAVLATDPVRHQTEAVSVTWAGPARRAPWSCCVLIQLAPGMDLAPMVNVFVLLGFQGLPAVWAQAALGCVVHMASAAN